MMRLPPAYFGDRSGNFDWSRPYEAWLRGFEVVTIDVPLQERTISLNLFAMGAAIAIAQEAPNEVWYFTVVNAQGDQKVWVGTGSEANSTGAGGAQTGNNQREPMVALTVWVGKSGVGRKRQKRVIKEGLARSPPTAPPEHQPLPAIVPLPAANPTVGYIRGLAALWKSIVMDEGSTQRSSSHPSQMVRRQNVCDRIDEVLYESSESLNFAEH